MKSVITKHGVWSERGGLWKFHSWEWLVRTFDFGGTNAR